MPKQKRFSSRWDGQFYRIIYWDADMNPSLDGAWIDLAKVFISDNVQGIVDALNATSEMDDRGHIGSRK